MKSIVKCLYMFMYSGFGTYHILVNSLYVNVHVQYVENVHLRRLIRAFHKYKHLLSVLYKLGRAPFH